MESNNINTLFIGLDLSFNSTGITLIYCEDLIPKSSEFHRLVYDKNTKQIQNLNQHIFTLPTNISVNDLITDEEEDWYSLDQAEIQLRVMVIDKRLTNIINKTFNKYPNIDNLYVNIEGFIGSQTSGISQLRVIGGLTILNGLIRSSLIKTKIARNITNFKLYITSPSNLKLFFTGNGNATKFDMLKSFNENFEGYKLLPDTVSLNQVNDVIDSFALAVNCVARVFYNWQAPLTKNTEKIKKSKLKNKKSKTIII